MGTLYHQEPRKYREVTRDDKKYFFEQNIIRNPLP